MEIISAYSEEINFLKENLEPWKDVPVVNISFQHLAGLSNIVWKVTANAKVSPQTVILRKFGSTEAVVDKDKESIVFEAMSEAGTGPKCFAKSSKYRVEEFFQAVPIKTEQIKQSYWRRKLALALAKHHSLEVSGISKDSIIQEKLKDTKFFEAFNSKCDSKDGLSKDQQQKLAELRALGLVEEKEFVESILPLDNLVFSHNDTLNGNILVTEKDKRIVLIDYEYSGFNNRAYDAANMFVESMMTYDKSRAPYFTIDENVFPKLEEIKDFARYYLIASRYQCMTIDDIESDESKLQNDDWLLEMIDKELNKDEFEKELELYMNEFEKCCLLSQYYWITWGVMMSKSESNPQCFDYLAFAHAKMQYYLKWKTQLQQAKSLLN